MACAATIAGKHQPVPAYRSTTILTAATTISAAMRTMTARDGFSRGRTEADDPRALTDPFQVLPMSVGQLVLEDAKQVTDDVEPLCQQPYTLIHLEVTSDSLIHGIQLWLGPHELRRI